jgi:tetratricopeptide (TPR) repeat protein
VCVVVGSPGVGKSAFAVRCGHAVRQRFPDGILHVDLRGFHPAAEPAAPVEVLAGFLRDLGMPETAIPGDLDRMTRLYRSRLHGRRTLIILDNAHNPDQVRPLLPGATTCGVVVTSRNAMTGLARDGAYRLTLGPLPPDGAIDLLVRITGGGAQRTLRRLAGLCAYHPLALCVAGFRPPQELPDFVEDLRARPLDPLDDPTDPAGSIKALFALSYRASPPGVRRTFRLLSLYPGATIPAAAADVLTRGEAGIRELLDAHLLERAGAHRYRFHDLLRAYATECADESEPVEERAAASRRALDWLRHTAETHDHVLDPWRPRMSPPGRDRTDSVDRAGAMAWFDTEVADLAAATQAALAGGHHELAWRLALAPSAYFYSRKPWTTWISTQETGLAAARATGELEAEAWLSDGLGVACREQGRHDDALRHFAVATARFVEVGNAVGLAETTLHVAQTHREVGELERARELADTARSIFRDAGGAHGEAKAANLLGGVYLALRDPVTALACTEQADAIFAQLGDEYSRSWAVNNLGSVLAKLGRRSEAIAAFRTAMAVRERIDRYGLAFTLHGLGDVLHDNGDSVEARRHWRAALAIFDEIGDLRAGQLRARLGMAADDDSATTSTAAGTRRRQP